MLKAFSVALFAIAMSVGLAQAKRHMHKQMVPTCAEGQQATASCVCGPAKTPCPKGHWCHARTSYCTRSASPHALPAGRFRLW